VYRYAGSPHMFSLVRAIEIAATRAVLRARLRPRLMFFHAKMMAADLPPSCHDAAHVRGCSDSRSRGPALALRSAVPRSTADLRQSVL